MRFWKREKDEDDMNRKVHGGYLQVYQNIDRVQGGAVMLVIPGLSIYNLI